MPRRLLQVEPVRHAPDARSAHPAPPLRLGGQGGDARGEGGGVAGGEAQRRLYRVRTEPLRDIDDWLAPYRQLWEARLDDLERHLDEM